MNILDYSRHSRGMQERFPHLRQVRVASPCGERWQGMKGDDQVRFCGQCQHKVYNLSEMTSKEAENLLLHHEGRLCVRYYQRQDGTVMTRNCPIGVAKAQRALRRGIALAVSLLASAFVAASRQPNSRYAQPIMGDPITPQRSDQIGKVAVSIPTTGMVSPKHVQGQPLMGTSSPIH